MIPDLVVMGKKRPDKGTVVTGVTAGGCWVGLLGGTGAGSHPLYLHPVMWEMGAGNAASVMKDPLTEGLMPIRLLQRPFPSLYMLWASLHPWSKICPFLAYMGVRVKMSPVPRGEKLEPGWGQERAVLWAPTTPVWLQFFPLDFLSGGRAGSCAWTSRACLCKNFENLELVLQTVRLFGWCDYLSVLQLTAKEHPTVLFGSTLICKDCVWQLVITSLRLQNFHFICHRSHQMLHLPVHCFFRQLCFQIHESGGDVHVHIYIGEKKVSTTFSCLFSLVCLLCFLLCLCLLL